MASFDEQFEAFQAENKPAEQPSFDQEFEKFNKDPESYGQDKPKDFSISGVASDYFNKTTSGRLAKAFGEGVAEPWTEGGEMGMSQETAKYFRDVGIFNDYAKGENDILKGFNEAIFRPAAVGLDAILRATTSVFTGYAETALQMGEETGQKSLFRDVAALPEAFMGGELHTAIPTKKALPEDIARARSVDAIGVSESVYMGTKDRTPKQVAEAYEAANMLPEHNIKDGGVTTKLDIHSVARNVSPETFHEYDILAEKREALRTQISEATAKLKETEVVAPHVAAIDELRAKIGTEKNKAELRRLRAQVRDLTSKNEAFLLEAKKESPEIEAARAELQKVDYRMRDLSPEVSKAYATAQEFAPETSIFEHEVPKVEEMKAAEPINVAAEKVGTGIKIEEDVVQQLVKAGRPAEEAQLAAQLVSAHYKARSQRFGGQHGTPEEMYARDFANIRAGRERQRVLAQTDKTPIGEQHVLEGAEKLTDKQLAERLSEGGMKSTKPQKAMDEGLFDVAGRNQQELFQDPAAYDKEGKVKTESPEFKKWFGDSKVVDAEGKPLVVYHGTSADVEAFDQSKIQRGEGFWFGTARIADVFTGNGTVSGIQEGANISPVYLSIKKPLVYSPEANGKKLTMEAIIEKAKSGGHDGVEMKNATTGEKVYLAFEPEQIKSVFNRGTFDANDPRILYQGGEAPVFYSQLTKSIEDMPQGKGSPEQWKGIIKNLSQKGVKAEEIDWSGVNEWLDDQKGTVTKADLLEHIRQNEVRVEEVVKQDASPDDYHVFSTREGTYQVRDQDNVVRGEFDTADAADDFALELSQTDKPENPTKFEQHVLPGGENYKELLLTLPPKMPQAKNFSYAEASNAITNRQAVEVRKDGQFVQNATSEFALSKFKDGGYTFRSYEVPDTNNQFKSSHFSEPNILAHIRFNERTDAAGNKVLFVEEVQSDWHQAGKKKGYKIKPEESEQLEARRRELEKLGGEARNRGEEIPSEMKQEWADIMNRLQPDNISKVSNAPFKSSWPELAMKRMLRYAVDNGFDKISWTTGEQQAARYDLSKQVDEIRYVKAEDGTYDLLFRKDGRFIEQLDQIGLSPDKLEDFVGKDVAKRILGGEGEDVGGGGKELSGADLKIGGEGMKGFYDKILPAAMNKYAKKWGGRVEESKIPSGLGDEVEIRARVDVDGETTVEWGSEERHFNTEAEADEFIKELKNPVAVHSLEITPAMRESIEKGQPLFQQKKGSIRLATDDAKATITLMKSADASTFIHETGHHWLDELVKDATLEKAPQGIKDDVAAVNKWLGVKEGEEITTKQHEKFARGFERYFMEGVAPSKELAGVFAKFKNWLVSIYRTVDALRSPITEDIRNVFDRLLSAEPQRTVIAPEAEAGKIVGNIHEKLVDSTPPEKAAEVADSIRATIDRLAKNEPEIRDALARVTESPETLGGVEGAIPTQGQAAVAGEPTAVSTGGSQLAGKSPEAPRAVKSEIYSKVPKKPKTLAEWLSDNGGVKEYSGELAGMNAELFHKGKPFQKKLVRDNGMELDDAALMAWEKGYFPELQERPTVNEFLEKLAEDLKGNSKYSELDRDLINEYEGAISKNEEIDRLADRFGIETTGKTKDQFWDAVAEKVSLEEQDKFLSEIEAANAELLKEAEAKEKEFLESRGEAWEPEEPNLATLEDLENDRRQEIAAREPQTGAAGDGTQEPATGGTQPVPEGLQPSGRGIEPDGSTGEAAIQAETREPAAIPEPTGPNDRFGKSATDLLDKAGNIRLDNLGTPADVNRVLSEIAESNNEFIPARRGIITAQEQLDLADALGMNADKLDMRKIGEAFNAEQIIASRKLLVQSASELRTTMGKAANGSEADVLAYAEARARHIMIQEHVAGITAEAGRALGAFRKLEGAKEAKALGDFLKESTGRDLFQLQKEAQLGMQLDTPQKISKFIQDSKKAKFSEMMLEYWINALLSGPMTHVKNIVGNSMIALNSVAETAVAAGVGRLLGSTDGVQLGEAKARLYGITQGGKEGLQAAKMVMKNEDNISGAHTVEAYRQKAIPSTVGKVVRIPTRFLSAEDEIFKAIGYRQELNALAYRQAVKEGLSGERLANRVAEIVTNPTEGEMASAIKNAEYQTFTNSLGPTGRAVQNFANSYPALKFIFPFIRTPANIIKYAAERTPFGLLSKEIKANIMGVNGTVAKETQIARLAIGSSIAVTSLMMAAEGQVTGGGPTDPREKAMLRATGWQPYSVLIGDMYYSYQWLDPFSTIFGSVADMYETYQAQMSEDESVKIGSMVLGSISQNILSKLSLRGVSDLIQAVTDPDRYGERYIQNLISSFVPTASAQVARTVDPVQREVRSTLDAIKARVPGLRQELLPRRDVWGEPIVSQGSAGPNMISPIYETRMNTDPVNQALLKLNIYPSKLQRKIRGVELTDKQYDDFQRIAGRMAKIRLDALVTPGFTKIPEQSQAEVINKIISSSRETARSTILMQNPDLVKKATDNKLQLLRGKSTSQNME